MALIGRGNNNRPIYRKKSVAKQQAREIRRRKMEREMQLRAMNKKRS